MDIRRPRHPQWNITDWLWSKALADDGRMVLKFPDGGVLVIRDLSREG